MYRHGSPLLFAAWVARRLLFSRRRDIRADELVHELADRSCIEHIADELSGCLRDGSAGKDGTDRRIAQSRLLGEVVLAHKTASELVSEAMCVEMHTHRATRDVPAAVRQTWWRWAPRCRVGCACCGCASMAT